VPPRARGGPPPDGPEAEPDVEDEPGQQHRPLRPPEGAVGEHGRGEDGDADEDGEVRADELGVHPERTDERCHPEDEADVGDVAPHHIPHGDPALPCERGLDAHDELRRARPEGHYRQPDDERAHPVPERQRGGPAHERLGADVQEADASED